MVVPKPHCRVLRYPRFCGIFRRKTGCIRRRRKAGTTGIWAIHTLNLSSYQLAPDFTIGIHNSWRTCRKFGVIPMSSNIIFSFGTVNSQTSHNPYFLWAVQWVLIKPCVWLGIFWHHDTTTWGIAIEIMKQPPQLREVSRLAQGSARTWLSVVVMKFLCVRWPRLICGRLKVSPLRGHFKPSKAIIFSPPNYCYLQTDYGLSRRVSQGRVKTARHTLAPSNPIRITPT